MLKAFRSELTFVALSSEVCRNSLNEMCIQDFSEIIYVANIHFSSEEFPYQINNSWCVVVCLQNVQFQTVILCVKFINQHVPRTYFASVYMYVWVFVYVRGHTFCIERLVSIYTNFIWPKIQSITFENWGIK